MFTYIVFEGGSRDGETIADRGLEDHLDIFFDTPFEPRERYRRTSRTRMIGGVEHLVFRLTGERLADWPCPS
ncbi:MAG TPA: hypothetical protein VI172_06670 [Candidatus Dormibacteraeota bacterium]|jgi:hypothetical protein